jgi:hypothetical protein
MQAPKRERSGTIVPGTTRNQDALRIAPGRCSGPALISAGQAQSRPGLPSTVENTAPSAADVPRHAAPQGSRYCFDCCGTTLHI